MFVELKTPGGHVSRKNAEAVAAEVDATGNMIILCSFGDDVFKKVTSNSGCRVQMIHHSTMLQLEFGLFVVLHGGKMRVVLLVHFPAMKRRACEVILTKCVSRHLRGFFFGGNWPALNQQILSDGKCTVEPETVKFLFGTRKKIERAS